MYLHLGSGTLVNEKDIIGIFDLEITSQSFRTRNYLNEAERRGHLVYVDIEEIPKSFVVCAKPGEGQTVILSPLSPQTLQRRGETGSGLL
ncbi:MAG: DUF370 domain-containing protein [Oscillospiraceae bacterium]|nr:DUF370 domain-containing protein [Oscillospiraceae bacterium]